MVAATHAALEHDVPARPVLGLAPRPAPAPVIRYEAEPTRCVIEAVLRNRGIALWRVRLRPIAVALTLPARPDELDDAPEQPSYATLTAQLSSRPRYASLPGTRGLFLPNSPREQWITFAALSVDPTFTPGSTSTSTAAVMLGTRLWPVELTVETVHNDGDRIIAAITGELPRDVPIPFGRCAMHIDAAVEFRRWT